MVLDQTKPEAVEQTRYHPNNSRLFEYSLVEAMATVL